MRSLAVAAVMLACMVICMFSYGARAAEFNVTPNGENAAPLTKLSADEGTEFVKEYYAALSRVDIPAVVAKFAETVDYEGEGQRDRSYIRSDLEKYVARWPILSFKPEATTVSPKKTAVQLSRSICPTRSQMIQRQRRDTAQIIGY